MRRTSKVSCQEPIELPKERELTKYEKAVPKARAKAAAKAKAASKAGARARVVNQPAATADDEIRAQVDWCSGFDEITQFQAWDREFDHFSLETYIDLGQTDMQDFDEGQTPMEVSLGEQDRVSSTVRPAGLCVARESAASEGNSSIILQRSAVASCVQKRKEQNV